MIGYPQHNFIEVSKSNNKIHKNSRILGGLGNNVVFLFDLNSNGIVEEGVTMRGDLGKIDIANNVVFQKHSTIKPPPDEDTPNTYKPVSIGSFVKFGEKTVCSAMSVGSWVTIGKNCVIGDRVVIRDCVRILDNTVIPADSIVPPLTIFGGKGGEFQSEAPECSKDVIEREVNIYLRSYMKTFSI